MSLRISDEVDAALHAGNAVVALESTIIAHGLPWPQNLEVADELEQAKSRIEALEREARETAEIAAVEIQKVRDELGQVRGPVDLRDVVEDGSEEIVGVNLAVEAADHLCDLRLGIEIR